LVQPNETLQTALLKRDLKNAGAATFTPLHWHQAEGVRRASISRVSDEKHAAYKDFKYNCGGGPRLFNPKLQNLAEFKLAWDGR